jgi:hypothetical protein
LGYIGTFWRKFTLRLTPFLRQWRRSGWAARQEAEIMAGVRGEVPNLTVKALLERYRKEVSPTKKGRAVGGVRLLGMERDRIAQVKLRQLDAPHVSDWQTRRLRDVSSASVRRERNLLTNVFNIAINEWRWLAKNPFKGYVGRRMDGRGTALPAQRKSRS